MEGEHKLRQNKSSSLRRASTPLTEYDFKFHGESVVKVDWLWYLGIDLRVCDKLDYSHSINIWSAVGGRSYGHLIANTKTHGLPYKI